MICPDWPAPLCVQARITQRSGGISQAPYHSFNLAAHVGDAPQAVVCNRQQLAATTQVAHWQWLEQVHGTHIITAQPHGAVPVADGATTQQAGLALAILTADCLPLLLCNQQGTQVCALHAGWRGLAAGIVDKGIACFAQPATQLMAYLGPCIGPSHFEVGPEVKTAFLQHAHSAYPQASHLPWHSAFVPSNKPQHWLAHLALLARLQLNALGVTAVFGGNSCTYSQPEHYYSYRREAVTGRFATVIWLNPTSQKYP